jgi:hypothetical protein
MDPLSTLFDQVTPAALVESYEKAERNWKDKLRRAFPQAEVLALFGAISRGKPEFSV